MKSLIDDLKMAIVNAADRGDNNTVDSELIAQAGGALGALESFQNNMTVMTILVEKSAASGGISDEHIKALRGISGIEPENDSLGENRK